MAFLVRKIIPGKWLVPSEEALSDEFADSSNRTFAKRFIGWLLSLVPTTDQKRAETPVSPIPADAITGCLRTSGNTLSVWRINDNSDASVEEAELALAGSQENCDTFSYLILEEHSLIELGLQLSDEKPGTTAVSDLAETHRDIVGLDYESLGKFAQLLRDKIQRNEYSNVTRSVVKRKLSQAVDDGRVDKTTLPKKIRKELKFEIQVCDSCPNYW